MPTPPKKRKGSLSLQQWEENLRLLGLSEEQIKDLGDTIDVIGDRIFDEYLEEFYE